MNKTEGEFVPLTEEQKEHYYHYSQGYSEGCEETTKEIFEELPKWKHGTPPKKGWWLTKTKHEDGHYSIACETFRDDKWPHDGDDNVMYMDMNDLVILPEEGNVEDWL